MKKICFITTIPLTLRAFVLKTAIYLHENTDWDISFICNSDEKFGNELPEFIHYYPVKMERGISISGLKAIREIKMIFDQQKFDMIQYSTPNADILRAMMNDEKIEEMMWGYSFPVSEYQQKNWIEKLSSDVSSFRAMIEVDGITIGTIILSDIDLRNGSAEIHIKLANEAQRGKGHGTDAVLALINYAFNNLRLNCVYCRVKEDNFASQRMFKKCGFVQDGILRSRVYRNGRFFDFYEYSILREEFYKQQR